MSTLESLHEQRRGAAGCPPVLGTDVSRNDVVDPVVEWPPAPPTRSTDGDGRVDDADAVPAVPPAEAHADGTVAWLAVSRGRQLLDASVDHLRTALETSPDEATAASVEAAIRDRSLVCERLDALDA